MRKLKSLQLQKLKRVLKKCLDNEIVDIFIIGSFLKNKLEPSDIDLIVLFKDRDLPKVGKKLHKIKEKVKIKNIHIEPIFVESMFSEAVFVNILHEGFSIKNNKKVSSLLKLKSFVFFNFSLINLSNVEKVRFAQALYGRHKDGLLYMEKGDPATPGAIKVLVEKEEIFKEFFEKWKVKYKRERVFVND